MNISTYLQAKYQVDIPTTMLGCEARIFGIPYPLRHLWLEQHGGRTVTAKMANQLLPKLRAKGGVYAPKAIELLVTISEEGCVSPVSSRARAHLAPSHSSPFDAATA